jgi:UDP-N-acetylmuramoyl-tripeptide--D-alanyl-D-alanine ligase
MRAALELLKDFDSCGRRIVVCGDMAEAGAPAAALHWQLGKQIVALGGAELLIACGRHARHVAAGARAAGMVRSRAIPCDSVEDALPYLGRAILPGDVVLVKGSSMMDRRRVVEALDRYPERRSA